MCCNTNSPKRSFFCKILVNFKMAILNVEITFLLQFLKFLEILKIYACFLEAKVS